MYLCAVYCGDNLGCTPYPPLLPTILLVLLVLLLLRASTSGGSPTVTEATLFDGRTGDQGLPLSFC